MKTIDVRDGDRFERESHRSHAGIYQYRREQCRFIKPSEVSEWFEDGDEDDEYKMDTPLAIAHLKDWGYTLTPGEGEKPRTVKPELTVDAIKADVTVAIARINGLAKWIAELESRLAALEKPAPKPAARVVKAPRENGMHTPVWWQGWQAADAAWRKSLSVGNVTVADEGSSK